MIDINTATPDELREAMSLIATRLAQIEQEAATTEEGLRAQLGSVVTDLDNLIGDGDPKGTGSIVAVRQYTGDEMAAAAQVALPLVFHGLEILARATRDLARVVGD